MLHVTKIELELLTDIDMVIFIERGIRGGLSQCSKRYAKANNKYMHNFNDKEPSKSSSSSYKDFEWYNGPLNFCNYETSEFGYALEVDLEYPEKLHDLHSDLPFCPERDLPPTSKNEKLLTTLNRKEGYVIHHLNLFKPSVMV